MNMLTLEALDQIVGERPMNRQTPKIQPQGDYPDLVLLESMLEAIPADVARGDGAIFGPDGQPNGAHWFGVILAARGHWGEAAKPILKRWSQTSDRFEDAGFEQAWDQFDADRQKRVTVKSLRRLAEALGWKVPPSSSRYRLLDRDAMMAMKPLEWRLKGIFPRTGIGAIYGPSGSGKSFLAIDMGLKIASGLDWYGRRTIPCPVTYVMLEGEAGLRNRVVAWETSYGTAISAQFYGMPQGFAFAENSDVADLAATLPTGGVVIVDTLNRAAPGKDENSSKDMGDVLAGMKLLQSLTEGLVLVVHHTGKDTSKGLRGHSSLHAALDGAIEVKRTAASRSWSSAKVKDGADDFEIPFKLGIIHLGFDDDGDEVTSCVAVPDPEALFMPKPPGGQNQKLALEALRRTQQPAFTEAESVEIIATALEHVPPNRRRTQARDLIQSLTSSGHLRVDGEDIRFPVTTMTAS